MLLVDIGNSRIKSALWRDGQLSALPVQATRAEQDFAAWSALPRPDRVVVSNVAGAPLAEALGRYAAAHWHSHPEFVTPSRERAGMTTAYDEPARLGVDRWLAALAAWHLCHAAVCVVDMGTALTVDVVDARGHHRGGLIAPGLELMRTSLTRGTAQLTSTGIHAVAGFATNTADAIALGCSSAVAGLLEQVRVRLGASAGTAASMRWYLTGGGAPALQEMVTWPHVTDPDLVLRGLIVVAETPS